MLLSQCMYADGICWIAVNGTWPPERHPHPTSPHPLLAAASSLTGLHPGRTPFPSCMTPPAVASHTGYQGHSQRQVCGCAAALTGPHQVRGPHQTAWWEQVLKGPRGQKAHPMHGCMHGDVQRAQATEARSTMMVITLHGLLPCTVPSPSTTKLRCYVTLSDTTVSIDYIQCPAMPVG